MDQSMQEAGFRDLNEEVKPVIAPAGEASPKIVRLNEVRQLVVPNDAQLPEQMGDMQRFAIDLAELGSVICAADKADEPIIILMVPDAVLLAAYQYPSLFRLKSAVVRNIPGATYSPLFNQAVFGLNEVSWGYLIDTLDLDDRLAFDTKGGKEEADEAGYRHAVDDQVDNADTGAA